MAPPPPRAAAAGRRPVDERRRRRCPPGRPWPRRPATRLPALAYNPYGYPGYQGAVGGALSGAADVISAQGQFQIANQQSRMLQTQADCRASTTASALIQEQRYEQSLLPTTLELRQKEQWQKLQTARNNPTNP